MFIKATEEIRSYATIRYPWNKTCNTPIFTGVSPHVMIMVEMEELNETSSIKNILGEMHSKQVVS